MSIADRLLSATTPDEPTIRRAPAPPGWTPGYEWDGDKGTLTTTGLTERPKTWDEFIRDAGLDPEDVDVVGPVQVRGWDAPAAGGDTVRMHYYRLTLHRRGAQRDITALIDYVRTHKAPETPPDGPYAFILAAGDMQLAKMDGDGLEGTLERSIASIDAAVRRLRDLRTLHPVGHVHIAWLGDHIEGFLSQGGANVWRTQTTLSDQIELATELMLYAVKQFAPLAGKVTQVAVPGNHGETTRFAGKGVTRYDDSFDTLSMKNVARALRENPAAYGHVQTWTPKPDELTVTVDIAGTVVTHCHGHQWRPGKHMEWWKGQAFGNHPAAAADLLLAGHMHHLVVDTSSKRSFIQVPALESQSVWWRHATGETGNPGMVTLLTRDGQWSDLGVV